jgi:hypothetical protein
VRAFIQTRGRVRVSCQLPPLSLSLSPLFSLFYYNIKIKRKEKISRDFMVNLYGIFLTMMMCSFIVLTLDL